MSVLTRRKGNVRLRPFVFLELMNGMLLSTDDVSHMTELDHRTIEGMVEGKPVHRRSVQIVFDKLGIENYAPYLLVVSPSETEEWMEDKVITPDAVAANGLEFRLSQMRHRTMTSVLARGKCYNLAGMKSLDEEHAEEMLVRHSRICHLIGGHPHIATNLSCKKSIDENSWWVIDQWVAGKSLSDVLRSGPLESTPLRKTMTQVASGLLALHKADVVYRHLNPSSILLREPDDSVVLTDFEHGKLFQHSITVKPAEGFRMDPFFAPEVSKNADRRADIYSFGRVFMTAAFGEPPPIGKEGKAPKPNKIPATVWKLVVDCCAVLPSKRSSDATELLESLASWK